MSRYAEKQAARAERTHFSSSDENTGVLPIIPSRREWDYDSEGRRIPKSRRKRDFRNPDPFKVQVSQPDFDFVEVQEIQKEPEKEDFEVVEAVLETGAKAEPKVGSKVGSKVDAKVASKVDTKADAKKKDLEAELEKELEKAREQRERAEKLLQEQTRRLIDLLAEEEAESGRSSEAAAASNSKSASSRKSDAGKDRQKTANKVGEKMKHKPTEAELEELSPSVELIMNYVEKIPPSKQAEALRAVKRFVEICSRAKVSLDTQGKILKEYNSIEQKLEMFDRKARAKGKDSENFEKVLGII